MLLANARAIAESLACAMRPWCDRVEIAGSIRREKPEVGDIEIVAIARWDKRFGDPANPDLFMGPEPYNCLHSWATITAGFDFNLRWIKPGTSEIIEWPLQPKGKYWRGYLSDADMKLDLFLANADNFGAIYLIRTGDADFSREIVTHANDVGYKFEKGRLLQLTQGGLYEQPVETPDEETVFARLGLTYVPPKERIGAAAVRPVPSLPLLQEVTP